MSTETKWTQAEAIEMCILLESVAPKFGCHVALTGGLLYKQGPRKDCDVLFYRIRQVDHIDKDKLFEALNVVGFTELSGFGWCHKAIFNGKHVDCFFPEAEDDGPDGEYNPTTPVGGGIESNLTEVPELL